MWYSAYPNTDKNEAMWQNKVKNCKFLKFYNVKPNLRDTGSFLV